MEPVLLYAHGPTANPVKVAIVLEELGLPYKVKETGYDAIKVEPYITLNPNGRLPAIEDPNTGFKLFEVFESLLNTKSGTLTDFVP